MCTQGKFFVVVWHKFRAAFIIWSMPLYVPMKSATIFRRYKIISINETVICLKFAKFSDLFNST